MIYLISLVRAALVDQQVRDIDLIAVCPEPFKLILRSGITVEHMHDDIAVIQHDPACRTHALDAACLNAQLAELKIDLIRQRLDLCRAGTGRNDKIICNDRQIRDADDLNILGFFAVQNLKERTVRL